MHTSFFWYADMHAHAASTVVGIATTLPATAAIPAPTDNAAAISTGAESTGASASRATSAFAIMPR